MSNRGMVSLLALALLATLGCGDDDEPVAEPEPAPEPAPEPEPAAPLSCALEGEPLLLADVVGPTAITPVGDAFVLASFAPLDEGGEDFWLGRVAPDAEPVELAKVSVSESEPARHPNAAPAVATIDAQTIAVAVVGRKGALSAGRLELAADASTLKLAPVENGARRTEPPVVVPAGDRLAVAWTQASTYEPVELGYFCGFGRARNAPPEPPPPPPEPLHGHQVRLALVDADGTVHTRRDATPRVEGAEAVAPAAIVGAESPTIAFLDTRAAIGTIQRVGVRAQGFVEPETVRPLSHLRDQTDIAVADGPGGPWFAYSAVGDGATTAIGLVSLANERNPVPLVPGTGYRPLRVDGAAIDGAAIFAAEVPKGTEQNAPSEIHVRAANEAGLGEPLVLRAPDGDDDDSDTDAPALEARVRMGMPDVRGSLSPGVIRRLFRYHLSELVTCHAEGLQREPQLRGALTVRLIISPTGAVQNALLSRSEIGDEETEACITSAIRGWTFPEPPGGGVVVATYPMTLGPPGQSTVPEAPPPADSAFSPAIAARSSDGLLAVAYSTAEGVHVAWVRCR